MSYDAVISIFGTSNNAEALWDLTCSASSDGKIDWNFDLSIADFVGMLEEANKNGTAIVLTQKGQDIFEGVREACREAGLSYVCQVGDSGAEDYTNGFSWKPGMPDEQGFILSDNKVALDLDEVREALWCNGTEGVQTLIDNAELAVKVGQLYINEETLADFHENYVGTISDIRI